MTPHFARPIQATADRAVTVHAPDLDQHPVIALRSGRRRPGLVRVIGRRGDPTALLAQHCADRLDPEPVPMHIDELHYHGSRGSSSRAKKLDAANKISFARLSS
jgi:hypothetical protein